MGAGATSQDMTLRHTGLTPLECLTAAIALPSRAPPPAPKHDRELLMAMPNGQLATWMMPASWTSATSSGRIASAGNVSGKGGRRACGASPRLTLASRENLGQKCPYRVCGNGQTELV